MRLYLVVIALGEGYSMDDVDLAIDGLSKDSLTPAPGIWVLVSERPLATLSRKLERFASKGGKLLVLDVQEAPQTGLLDDSTWRWIFFWKR